MNARAESKVAALPQHSAERLCLSVAQPKIFQLKAVPRALLTLPLLLLTAHCLLPSAYCSGWTRQPSGTMAWLHAVHFIDQNHGWVAGSSGTLLQTSDGGVTWTKTLVNKDDLRDVYFLDERNGWLLAQRDPFKAKSNERLSYLLNTKDGGNTWRPVFLNTPDVNTRFARLVFADAERGWVFGETGVLFATTDGGANWNAQRTATKHLLLGGMVAQNGRGFLVGAGGTILRSGDFGATWQPSSVGAATPARLNAVSVIGNFAWTIGGPNIFRTIDAGHSWLPQQSYSTADLLDIKFIDAQEGWAVGAQGTVLHTVNGGLHWSAQSVQHAPALERLFILDRDHAWAVGFGGTILKLGASNPPYLRS
jgi:photosystem II stability/assembly factor-like uncharacterized protein